MTCWFPIRAEKSLTKICLHRFLFLNFLRKLLSIAPQLSSSLILWGMIKSLSTQHMSHVVIKSELCHAISPSGRKIGEESEMRKVTSGIKHV